MHANDITPGWVQDRLRAAGQLHDTTSIESIDIRPVGTGQVADSYRITPTYTADSGNGPTSIVAKVTADGPHSRAAGRTEMNYVREVHFYQDIADKLHVRVPRCYHSEIDSNNTEFVLLLEDLAPACQGDQLAGVTVDQTHLAVQQAARIHAAYWNSDALRGLPWLDISATYWARFAENMPTWFAGFEERYAPHLSADDIALGAAFSAHMDRYYSRLSSMPFTVQHGDYRPDNVLFEASGGTVPIAVLDWQTIIFGPGVVDVAYFIGGALDPRSRRDHEKSLLRTYHTELTNLGVDYPFDDLEADYAIATFQNFVIGVAAAMLVERTDRGDLLFVSMVTRSLQHARDRNAAAALGLDLASADV
ncbi:phosphotransferase [Rhodococcus pyridinivorans]|uniref:phosphotransferase n=1 Tax=Rhodococcus pyridinivorans TaxID=103816 RepID=UPI0022849840|nr:phosphotransferase [Rhodococcus pyridinivorans]WAL49322.1 phosphotransferase [Rhodococcus pyridinivorans]